MSAGAAMFAPPLSASPDAFTVIAFFVRAKFTLGVARKPVIRRYASHFTCTVERIGDEAKRK